MERVVALVLVLAVISSSYGLTETFEGTSGKVTVENGQVGIGEIAGGSFGPGSFSIAGPGGASHGLPANTVLHGGPIIINPPPKSGVQHQGNLPPKTGEVKPSSSGGGNLWNAGQNNQVNPQRAQANPGQKEFAQSTTNGGHGGQGGNFQDSQDLGFQGGQGGGSYPGLGGQAGHGGGFEGGQGASFRPGQGVQGSQEAGIQKGQGASFRPGQGVQGGQGGLFQKGQEATFLPGQEGSQTGPGGSFRPGQGLSIRPGQGGSIQIGSITGGTFEKFPNLDKNNRKPSGNIPYKGFNTVHSNAGNKQQLTHGCNGNTHEEVSDESSYSEESAEEPEPWVWGVS